MDKKYWKVGELAKKTGLTVRMLHHYDKVQLFSPSEHTDSGHRLYTEEDIEKLQQLLSLKQLGFSLEEIKEIMNNPKFDPIEVIKVQLQSTKERICLQKKLYDQLEKLYTLIKSKNKIHSDEFFHLIEVTNMNTEKYFSEEQLAKMGELVQPGIRKPYMEEWVQLIDMLRSEMKKGTPAQSLDVSRLAELNEKLVGNRRLSNAQSAGNYFNDHPELAEKFGLDKELRAYLHEALANV
ncbi:MerR family transcriptional regulator [Peribacillus loiseleuriae]|uniref:MerR family transcriptional regulator n=1 Tax=Peribacillus loiseleuriae TaxID=1679170 RepID=UPI00382AAF74